MLTLSFASLVRRLPVQAVPARAVTRVAIPRLPRSTPRFYSAATDDAPPPLLSKIKADLKTAMRAKDAPRLAVLRAIMSANLNASKTASPIRTDVQLVGLIRKLQRSANDSVAEAKEAGRDDLVEKEMEQIRVYDQYLADSGVAKVTQEELQALVSSTVDTVSKEAKNANAVMGEVMKRVKAALEGKDVDLSEIPKMVKEAMK
ncbi:Yqey-like protein-domain-containing protein [Stachybotrys elegans]|uniref:Altered inheritance of mitochondria protein 41 n=1 Tax=Stachybotrys elegans TaxID=80388 RepID=A0A8K0WW73_9HYPO|nr:Yqey-like protein-domain-containing protein [Stachybotrys elegans]